MDRETKIFVRLLEEEDEEHPLGDRALCTYAEQFLQWTESLYVEHSTTAIKIAQAKVLLLDKYYDWRNYVPRAHRFHATERGHACIYHVLDYAYRKLRLAELAQTPPLLFVPRPPPPPPAAPVLEATILGLEG